MRSKPKDHQRPYPRPLAPLSRAAVLLLVFLFLFAAAGCTLSISFDENGGSPSVSEGGDPDQREDDPPITPQGSATYLRGDVLLISIYVTDGETSWTKEQVQYTKDAMEVATTWLEEKAKEHGQELSITWEGMDLLFRYRSDGLIAESQKDFSIKYSDAMETYLSGLKGDALRKKYKCSSVGYLFFLPGEGTSFTIPYVPTGVEEWDILAQNEYCNLYLYDGDNAGNYENPATYAHEILHLFGACDLYEENKGDRISKELVEYVETAYPGEIMYYTYEDDNSSNYEAITKDFSPFTLYFLDWAEWDDSNKDLALFPEIKRKNPAAFEAE